jgi:prephenate dehydratase
MVKISIQGTRGSYHDIVARHQFPDESEIIESPTYQQVFEDVKKGTSDYGVVAIENSSYGSFLENYDYLMKYDIKIIAETYLHIISDLIGWAGVRLSDITEVYSHPQAFADCHLFLEQHPQMRRIETDDTAGAVRMIKEKGLRQAAAIGSKLAAEVHSMAVLARDIGSNKKNYTRFLIIARQSAVAEKSNKTSLVIRAKNVPGSLFQCLKCFADEKINLSKLESRPIVGDIWQYHFYIDFERGLGEPESQRAMKCLTNSAGMIKVLGTYMKGSMLET